MTRHRHAFTLIELLIVTAIIAIISGALIATLIAPLKEQAATDLDADLQHVSMVFFARLTEDVHCAGALQIEEDYSRLTVQPAFEKENRILYFVSDDSTLRRWEGIAEELPAAGAEPPGLDLSQLPRRRSLAVDPTGGALVAVGTVGGLWVSADSGSTWSGPVATVNGACPEGEWTVIHDLVFTPEPPHRLWVGTSCGVFLGEEELTAWRRSGLEGEEVTALASRDGSVWAGTRPSGLWARGPGDQSWRQLTTPAGVVGITSLDPGPDGRRLHVSTAANGVFALDLPGPPPRRPRRRMGDGVGLR